jgi:hypothetical protein
MPRYFFHVMDGRAQVDSEGTELPDITAVRKEAVRTAGEMLAGADVAQLPSGMPWQMTVADETGKTVYSLRFESKDY